MNDFTFTERTLTENFPIQMIDRGGLANATWTISMGGEEVFSTTTPIVDSGRTIIFGEPSPLSSYMELFE